VFLTSLGDYTDGSDAAGEAVKELEGLVAGALLDVSCTVPLLVRALHEQVGRFGRQAPAR
jgi:hypothetical protein